MAYPAIVKAKAQKLYESDTSHRDIAKKLKVSPEAVMSWITKGKWQKGILTAQIQQKEEESILAIAEKIGATKEFIIKKAYELANAENIVLPASNGFSHIPMSIDRNTNENGEYSFMGISGEHELEVTPDRKSQNEGVKLLSDILKMRDKDMTITLPETIVIKASNGEVVKQLGAKAGHNPT